MADITFIYFDLGNVLLRFSHEVACRRMAETAGVSAELVREAVFDSQVEHAYERGELSSHDFYEYFCRATASRPDFQSLYHASADMFTLVEPMRDLVLQLHTDGRRLGVLSNTCESHWNYCLTHFPFLTQAFRHFVLSYQVRAMKPEQEIYRHAIREAGVPADQIFFTDDRPENVAGAREAGIDAVPFVSVEQLQEELASRGLWAVR